MFRELVSSKTFERSYKKFTRTDPALVASINETLIKLQENAFQSSLKTHKLNGRLSSLVSCSCGYDCRILFKIDKATEINTSETIVLIRVGKHDDVY